MSEDLRDEQIPEVSEAVAVIGSGYVGLTLGAVSRTGVTGWSALTDRVSGSNPCHKGEFLFTKMD